MKVSVLCDAPAPANSRMPSQLVIRFFDSGQQRLDPENSHWQYVSALG
jgi:hypothetical protein